MALLFRPWVESDGPQDATVSTTTAAVKEEEQSEGDVSRYNKYKCVKDHMRERSEKKHRRSRQSSKKVSYGLVQNHVSTFETIMPQSSGAIPLIIPPPVLSHLNSYNTQAIELFNDVSKDYWEELSISSPELVEAALAQGFQPGVLEDYVRVITEQQRQIAEKTRKQRPKKFRCPHCQVGFSNNGQLKGHIRIHTGERPFKCEAENCGKSFTRNEELTRHRRIHSGMRPFPCPDCGKRFGRKDHLKKHIRTHYQQRYQLLPIIPSHYPFLIGM